MFGGGEDLADWSLRILVRPSKAACHEGGEGGPPSQGEEGPPKGRLMEPRPSSAEFTVLPRAVPASSPWAPSLEL